VGFFDRPDDEASADRSGEGLERIEAGGIPLDAERRLRSLGGEGAPFTSTLSVGEFALLQELGPEPQAQVLGASVHQVGWQFLPSSAQWGGQVYCELDRVMHAWDQARRRAFDRLSQEARLVDADVVLGVRLRRGRHDWARNSVDYVVSGTAVRMPGPRGGGWPILSDLSVQDYWKLGRAGWAPAGLVAATSVFFVSQSASVQWRRRLTAMRNQELTEYSEGFYAARDTAIRYVHSQASAAGAAGIVGVALEHHVTRETFDVAANYRPSQFGGGTLSNYGKDKRSGLAITIQVVGTAIKRCAAAPDTKPTTVMRLGDSE
jgi:uncharacterized protein YbjQ (UPF0145 family)